MKFVFKFKKHGDLLWARRVVIGHKYAADIDRMTLYAEDGSIEEVPSWSKYHAKLGTDWVLAVKKKMEQEAGAAIPVNVG